MDRRGFLGGLLALVGASRLAKAEPPVPAWRRRVWRKADWIRPQAEGLKGLTDDGTFTASVHGCHGQRYVITAGRDWKPSVRTHYEWTPE